MDHNHFNTLEESRKPGRHLTLDERGQIQALHQQGLSLRAIAKAVGCAHTTIHYELKRGTPARNGSRGRKPMYKAARGQDAYRQHRQHSHRPCKIESENCDPFIRWMFDQVRCHRWSIDECVGYARLHRLFPAEAIPCTKTIYNMLWANKLPFTVFDLPRALSRKPRKLRSRKNKRWLGRSIEERPEKVNTLEEFGHWEADTVVGKKQGREAVIFTAVEKKSRKYIAIKIPSRTCTGVAVAMQKLKEYYGEHFHEIFKTITPDNGPEFEDFSTYEAAGSKIYFPHPYSPFERPQNERHNGLLREYLPKGISITQYSEEEILHFADEINARPRRILGYRTADEVFDEFLDEVYAINGCA